MSAAVRHRPRRRLLRIRLKPLRLIIVMIALESTVSTCVFVSICDMVVLRLRISLAMIVVMRVITIVVRVISVVTIDMMRSCLNINMCVLMIITITKVTAIIIIST